jgi:hypothetical protein
MNALADLLRYNLATVPYPAMLVFIGTGVAGLGLLWRRYAQRRGTRRQIEPHGRKPSSTPNESAPDNA